MRSAVAHLTKHNGAWLIHYVGELAADQPENENFDCASSFLLAKRIAVQGARNMEYRGKVRWFNRGYAWELEMEEPEEESLYDY